MKRVFKSEVKFTGKILTLRVDQTEVGEREWIAFGTGRSVSVVPVLPDGSVVLVRQYRHPIGGELLEIPAGKVDPGEEPLEAAKRELLEETGYRAASWTHLARFYIAPGYSNELMDLFLAEGLEKAGEFDAREIEELVVLSRAEVREWLREGKFEDVKTIAGLGLWLLSYNLA